MTVGFNTGSKWFDNYMEAFYEVIECYYKGLNNTYFNYSDYYNKNILPTAKATAKSLEGIYNSVYYNDYYEDFYKDYFTENSWETIWSGYGYGDCDVDKIVSKWGFSNQGAKGQKPKNINKSENDDSLLILAPSKFEKKFADKITNFSPLADNLDIDTDSFGINNNQTFAAGKNSKEIKKKLAKQDFDFLYDQKKGGLYFNENGADKGFGDGGITAILKGSPELTSSNLEFI